MASVWQYRTSMSTDAIEIAEARELIRTGRAREIRQRSGLSRGEVARDLGVAQSTITRWEDGYRVPRGEVAIRLGRLLRELSGLTFQAESPSSQGQE